MYTVCVLRLRFSRNACAVARPVRCFSSSCVASAGRRLTQTRAHTHQMHGRTNMVQANPGFQDHMFAMYTGASLKQMGGARGASADLGGSQGVGELSCSSMWRKSGILTLSPCRSFWHPPWWRCHRRVNFCTHSLAPFLLSLSLYSIIAQYNCGCDCAECGCDCAEALILNHTLREASGCGVVHDPHPPAAGPFPSLPAASLSRPGPANSPAVPRPPL